MMILVDVSILGMKRALLYLDQSLLPMYRVSPN